MSATPNKDPSAVAYRMSACICGLILLWGVFQCLRVQGTSRPTSGLIRVSANLVTVPVSVTDSAGRAVGDLGIEDFRIEEDGRTEELSKLSDGGECPLELALLFDLSGSVNPRFEFEQKTAIGFLKNICRPGDAISIVVFSDRPQVRLRNSPSLPDALGVLADLNPTKGMTAFFDSVILSARLLRQSAAPEARRALIALSDGEDNASLSVVADASMEIQRADTIFYAINPAGASVRLNEISRKGHQALESLAAETGGAAFVCDGATDLEGIFDRIGRDLRAQYLLSYYSSNPRLDGKFRRISVSTPRRPDLRIRARQGYYAVRK